MPSGVHVEKQRWVKEAQNSQAWQGGDSEGSGPHVFCIAEAMRRLGTPCQVLAVFEWPEEWLLSLEVLAGPRVWRTMVSADFLFSGRM